jgi:capsule polysaccharide export protein KpsE/RkpR
VVDEQLRALEEAPDVNEKGRARRATGGGPGMIPAAMAVPKLRAEYERLYRDRKVAEATLVFALDRLEGARASEARDVSTFQVLDPPTIATRRSRPKLIQSVAIGALLGLAAGLVFEMYRARKVIPRGEAASP